MAHFQAQTGEKLNSEKTGSINHLGSLLSRAFLILYKVLWTLVSKQTSLFFLVPLNTTSEILKEMSCEHIPENNDSLQDFIGTQFQCGNKRTF